MDLASGRWSRADLLVPPPILPITRDLVPRRWGGWPGCWWAPATAPRTQSTRGSYCILLHGPCVFFPPSRGTQAYGLLG